MGMGRSAVVFAVPAERRSGGEPHQMNLDEPVGGGKPAFEPATVLADEWKHKALVLSELVDAVRVEAGHHQIGDALAGHVGSAGRRRRSRDEAGPAGAQPLAAGRLRGAAFVDAFAVFDDALAVFAGAFDDALAVFAGAFAAFVFVAFVFTGGLRFGSCGAEALSAAFFSAVTAAPKPSAMSHT